MARRPMWNLHSAQGPPVLQSAPISAIRHADSATHASGVRSLSCAGPRRTSTSAPGAPKGCDPLD
eukprot:11450230-Alexandrium_andersonii.AAC.1